MTRFTRALMMLLASFLLSHGVACAALIDTIESRLQTQRVIRGEFTQTQTLVNVEKPFVSSGRFIFWREETFLWKTLSPIETATLFNNRTIDSYIDMNGQRIERHTPATTSFINRILWYLTAKQFNVLALDFQMLATLEDKKWTLTLLPITSAAGLLLKKVEVTGETFAETMTVTYESGDVTHLTLDNVTMSSASSTREEAERDRP